MTTLRHLPRSCTIEKKDFVLSLDNRSREIKLLITEVGKGFAEIVLDWNKIVVLTRRYFHDDWEKIVEKLKDQLDHPISYKPFHADKALIFFKDKEQANLICKNKGWTTVGWFYVKFEEWNQKAHASSKVVPSYGGWIKVRGIPLHAWNLESFIQIGDACGGYIDVVRETRELTNLIEAFIRIKDN
ncbi:cleavage and polyadenylation specificity factor subunit 1 [Cucumis melo var. makuwa]|uniref:Cleavage and polyadenylation specificity factor subunit 1 n=1 Tax=Cucumis melo var. makuwa TaxID=1194695 RepID=A0A5D3C3G6_CUCMM|nr:cleavage and polyadenylation specificity factor subunit 1 [Cucumis melo var. makuwa]